MGLKIDKDEWKEFRDKIVTLIHDNTTYPRNLSDIAYKLGDRVHRDYEVSWPTHKTANIQTYVVVRWYLQFKYDSISKKFPFYSFRQGKNHKILETMQR